MLFMIKIYAVFSASSNPMWSNERKRRGFSLPLRRRTTACRVTSGCCSFRKRALPLLRWQSTRPRTAVPRLPAHTCAQVRVIRSRHQYPSQKMPCSVAWLIEKVNRLMLPSFPLFSRQKLRSVARPRRLMSKPQREMRVM